MNKRAPEKLNDIMQAVLSGGGYLSACREAGIAVKWELIIGKKLAEHAQCGDIRDGILFVRVQSSAWRQEISFLKEKIMDNIRRHTDCDTVKDIVFY